MKDKFRMEAEEEKYYEFRESVAEMKRMKAEKERIQELGESVAEMKDKLRMAAEEDRPRNVFKIMVINAFVLLFYVSSH